MPKAKNTQVSMWPTHVELPSGPFALLEKILENVPRLDGCACAQHSELFDAGAGPARTGLAIDMCSRCPAKRRCRDFVDRMPRAQRVHLTGVWAGAVMR